jgi:hypothetical protein
VSKAAWPRCDRRVAPARPHGEKLGERYTPDPVVARPMPCVQTTVDGQVVEQLTYDAFGTLVTTSGTMGLFLYNAALHTLIKWPQCSASPHCGVCLLRVFFYDHQSRLWYILHGVLYFWWEYWLWTVQTQDTLVFSIVTWGLLGLLTVAPLWWLRPLPGHFAGAQGLLVPLGTNRGQTPNGT